MSRKTIIAIGLLAVFLVSGCVGQPAEDGQAQPGLFGNLFKKAEPINKPFVTGTEALKFFFEENAPPASALSSESFPLVVIAENRGATKVLAGQLKLTLSGTASGKGTGWQLSGGNTRSNTGDIESRTVTIAKVALPGGKEIIEFGNVQYMGKLPEKKSIALSIEACYPYQTILQSSLCAATRGGTCDPKAKKEFFSSSAPIAVTEFNQISATKTQQSKFDLSFKFTVANSGVGHSYATSSCNTDFLGDNVISDIFTLEEISYSGNNYDQEQLKCSKTLYNLPAKKDGVEVTCTLKDVSVTPNSNEPLVIKFNYVYKEPVKSSIDIIPVK